MGFRMTAPVVEKALAHYWRNWRKSRVCASAPVGVYPYGYIPPAGAYWRTLTRLAHDWRGEAIQ